MSRSGNVPIHGEVREVGANLGHAHFAGMALVVKEDKVFDVVDVRFLGSKTQMFEAHGLTNLIQQAWRLWHRCLPKGLVIVHICGAGSHARRLAACSTGVVYNHHKRWVEKLSEVRYSCDE